MILDKLLMIENNQKLFSYTFTKNKIPIWFYVRNSLFKEVINSEFSLTSPSKKSQKIKFSQVFKYLWKTVWKNPFFAPKKDIYIFGSDVVNVLEEKKYINRLYDSFFDLMPNKIQIFESSTNRKYVEPKKNTSTRYSDFIEVLVFVFSKFIIVKKKDKKEIKEMINFLNKNTSYEVLDDDYFSKLEDMLLIIASRVSVSSFIYDLFFKLKKPKLFILEDASYGMSAHILFVAKKLNITTAEYQHGYVGLQHRAYNHNLKYLEHKKYFPDYFLTYGEYWSSQCRLFSETVAIGSPYLERRLEGYKVNYKSEKILLFISSSLLPEKIKDMIITLKNNSKFNMYKFIFRPHPTERELLEERYGILKNFNIEIHNGNLYDILALSDCIVSDGPTTVLYEAMFFLKKIYVMDNDISNLYGSSQLFPSFKNSQELEQLILNEVKIEQDKNDIWDKDWKNNYQNFINKVLEIK